MTYWEQGSVPELKVQFNKPEPTLAECFDLNKVLAQCEAKFRIYYSDNTDGLEVAGTFPVLNASDPGASNPNGGSDGEEVASLNVGSGVISALMFSPWLLGMIAFVGFISLNRERFQMSMVLEEEESIDGVKGSSSEGENPRRQLSRPASLPCVPCMWRKEFRGGSSPSHSSPSWPTKALVPLSWR